VNAAEIRYLIEREADRPEALHWLGQGEAEVLGGLASPARRASFLLGRWAAKRAAFALLARRGQARRYDQIEIRAAASGAPEIWISGARAPMSLSLSHREGEALAVLGPAGVALGGDLEVVEPRSAALVGDFFTEGERARWEAAAPDDRDALAGLVWSAKESALKALGEGLRRDTRSVEVEIAAEADAQGWRTIAAHLAEGGALGGHARIDGTRILTIVAIGVTTPPEPLRR
jgi:phosphopantetheinyl transferase (holo-ACP synthase)